MHMNIKYGDENYLVRYLQAFLQEYYNKSLRVSGVYDEYTHSNLIEYLNLPNVINSEELYDKLSEDYPELFLYFIFHSGSNSVEFISKSASDETLNYMNSIKESLTDYLINYGWKLDSFINYTSTDVIRYKISMIASDRVNRFPNKDLLCMVNLFMNKYIYDYIISIAGSDGSISPNVDKSTSYKLAIVQDCEPDTYYTICHAYDSIINMTVGSSPYEYNQDLTINNSLSNVESFYLDRGSLHSYKTSSDCKSIVIQLQYGGLLSSNYEVSVQIKTGDVNLDGFVDNNDVLLLSDYLSSKGTSDEFKLTDQQLYACCIDRNKNPIPPDGVLSREPNIYDLEMLNGYVTGRIKSLGKPLTYTYKVDSNSVSENIIMVSKGHYEDNEDKGIKAESYFPSPSYADSPWMINDKLLNYILDMAITPYSDEEDIVYLQELLAELKPSTTFDRKGVFTDDMREMIRAYQIDNGISFHTGYLDMQTEAYMSIEINGIGSTDSTYENVYLSSGSDYIVSGEGMVDGDQNYIVVERIDVR